MTPRLRRDVLTIVATVLLAIVVLAPAPGPVSAQGNGAAGRSAPSVVNVSTNGQVRSVRAALKVVARGGTIIVHPGTYRDTTIAVTIPVTIVGDGFPVLDGESVRQIMTISADSVTVRGLIFRNVGVAYTEDLAAIRP